MTTSESPRTIRLIQSSWYSYAFRTWSVTECWGSPKSSNRLICLSRLWPFSVSRMPFVESRSWTKSGSVGTSNDSRSALPAQSRKRLAERLSWSTAPPRSRISIRHRPASRRFLRLREGVRRRAASRPSRSDREPLAHLTARVLPVPFEARRERRVVAVGLRRLLLPELRLRADVGRRTA